MKTRQAEISRQTRETDIKVKLRLDGRGNCRITTGMPFMDHMLELLGRHALVDLDIVAKGDLAVDYHHTVEDIGLVLGQALNTALGTRKGIVRYGGMLLPMDESLARVALDLGGRPFLVIRMACRKRKILEFDLRLIEEFLRAFVTEGRLNLHVEQLYGDEAHHAYEAVFKGIGRALRQAVALDQREKGVPSSKGTI